MTTARSIAAGTLVVVGFLLHCVVGYLYALTSLAFQGVALLMLWAIWLALLVLAIRRVRRPWYVFATPFLAVLIWVVYVSAHDALTG